MTPILMACVLVTLSGVQPIPFRFKDKDARMYRCESKSEVCFLRDIAGYQSSGSGLSCFPKKDGGK
jgi:hypothetical protein